MTSREHERPDINLADTIACPECAYSCPAHFNYCGMCGVPLKSVSGPGAERRLLTVMFVDLVGSSALSERIDAEELRELVREYQKICGASIDRYGGYVAQYLGDGVLAYFGYPVAHGDDTRRAAWAARAILETVETSSVCNEHQLSVRIGIHTGTVVIGEMGAGNRHERLALGDVPNLAARLEGLAEPGTAIVSQRTASLLLPYFDMVSRGEHPLKGFKTPMPVFAIGPERLAPNRERSPFVGRGNELAQLAQMWERATQGSLQTCLVTGEPGVGKSRLVEAFTGHLPASVRICLGTCSPFTQDRALCVLGDALGGSKTFQELREVFRPGSSPTVLVLEDVDWLDHTSRELLEELENSPRDRHILIVMTCRQTPSGRAGEFTTVALPPLDSDDVRRLLQGLLGPSVESGTVEAMVATCDGVPLFAEELARSYQGEDTPDALPDNLQASLMARLDRAPEARPLAQLASVLGREFPKKWLEAVWEGDRETLQEQLGVLQEHRILKKWEGSIAFPHSTLREVAYHSLLARDRRAYHERVAQRLEKSSLVSRDEIEVLAHHFSAAARPEEASAYWQQAGVRERARQADAEAASLLANALEDCLKSQPKSLELELQLRLDLIPVLTATQGYAAPAVVENCERVLELCAHTDEKSETFRALKGLWSYLFVRAEMGKAQQMAEQLNELAQWLSHPQYQAEAHWTLGLTACCGGRFEEAWTQLDQAHGLFQEVDTAEHLRSFGQAPLVYTLCHQAFLKAMQDRPSEARQLYQESIRCGLESGHPFSQTTAHLFAAWVEQLLGDKSAVEVHATQCLQLSEEYRSRHWAGFAQALLAWTRGDAGGVAEGLGRRRQVGALISLPYLSGLLADCTGESEELLEAAVQEATTSGQRAYLPGLLLRLSERARRRGNSESAKQFSDEFSEITDQLPTPLFKRLGRELLSSS